MRAVIQAANDKAARVRVTRKSNRTPVAELPTMRPMTTTQSFVVWAPIRAAEDPHGSHLGTGSSDWQRTASGHADSKTQGGAVVTLREHRRVVIHHKWCDSGVRDAVAQPRREEASCAGLRLACC